MRIAVVHDWLTGMRGGEAVLEAILDLFPGAELFSLIAYPEALSERLRRVPVRTSFLQGIPGMQKRYRHFLPLMPMAVRGLDVSGAELVLSSSHCVAKGVKKGPGAVHVSYVHAPMRYMWDRFDEYFGPGLASPAVRAAARAVRPFLQKWDRKVSGLERVDHLVANSRYIAGRIEEHYGRPAAVVHPFADLSRFQAPRRREDFFLMVGALAPYKRGDLAIEAANRLGLKLRIIGTGQDEARLRARAGPSVEFLGQASNRQIEDQMSRCRAFIFPGEEDFGITPLEAMAAGAPVVALGRGGALETVTERTGVFFGEPTTDALIDALQRLEQLEGPELEESCRKNAAQFTRERFQTEFYAQLESAWRKQGHDPARLRAAARFKA